MISKFGIHKVNLESQSLLSHQEKERERARDKRAERQKKLLLLIISIMSLATNDFKTIVGAEEGRREVKTITMRGN